jgi:4-amino-4-deoxy-L-arabinose transferase-like glycosyltransferase
MTKANQKIVKHLAKLRPIDFYIIGYFLINLIFLTQFPFMHSDESWLSGLTQSMMANGLGSTEYFFDLLPRYPHAIKTIYHVMQMAFISLFSNTLFAVRLLSLICGTLCLYAVYALSKHLINTKAAVFATVIISLDIQYIYASHFARQEIMILTIMLACIYYLLKNRDDWQKKNDIIMGAMIGLSVGIHPNSFLIALVIGALYIHAILFEKKLKPVGLALLIAVVIGFTAIFAGLSFYFDADFITHYATYGDNLGTTNSALSKVFGFFGFYQRLFNATSVTYYTPLIKFQLIAFALAFVISAVLSIFSKKKNDTVTILLALVAINIGYLLIGRYSQPSIVLIFPLGYLLIFMLISRLNKARILLSISLCLIIFTSTLLGIVPYLNHDYKNYIQEVKTHVPSNANVLANVNTEYAFDYNRLHDYRNLSKLSKNDLTFEQYIQAQEIAYIIYPQEMDFIYENRPSWNVVYGNVYPYYDDMQSFLSEQCEPIYTFNSPYAMRIVRFSQSQDWQVNIYRVKDH